MFPHNLRDLTFVTSFFLSLMKSIVPYRSDHSFVNLSPFIIHNHPVIESGNEEAHTKVLGTTQGNTGSNSLD
jgi:hypothetical protein